MGAMQFTMRHPALRWLAPAAVVVVVAGSVSAAHLAAAATPTGTALPDITAQQLLVNIAGAADTPVSGTVAETVDLGLPDLSGLESAAGSRTHSGSGTSAILGMLTGTHTMRVWADGPNKQRVAVLSSLAETDVIHDGQDLWTWDSSDDSVTHRTLPAVSGGAHQPDAAMPTAPVMPTTPAAAAKAALALIGPSTSVAVRSDATAAGRAAYQLTLTPKGSGSLVSAVRIDVDGATFVPLSVEVDSAATGAPAIQVGFTSVSFGAIDPAQFSFTPPPGATVKTADGYDAGSGSGLLASLRDHRDVQVVGSGWTSVLVARPGQPGAGTPSGTATEPPAPSGSDGGSAGPGALGALLRSLPTVSGSWGSGHMLAGTLFTVVVTDDGAVAIGAATPEVVTAALAHT